MTSCMSVVSSPLSAANLARARLPPPVSMRTRCASTPAATCRTPRSHCKSVAIDPCGCCANRT